MGTCRLILEYLERRGYVSNVVTLFTPDGKAVKYFVRTDMKIRDFSETELPPPLARSA